MSSSRPNLREKNTLDAALRYASAGYPIFPCRRNKRPRITAWQNEATTDERTIREWFARWPDAMIGMPCGVRSGVLVIDGDAYKSSFVASLDQLENECGTLPGTVTAKTGRGGVHWYFRSPGYEVVGGANKLGPGIDLRADGQYVVLPPSESETGKYRWVSNMTLLGTRMEVRELPAGLKAKLKRRTQPAPQANAEGAPESEKLSKRKNLHYLGEASLERPLSPTPFQMPIDLVEKLDGSVMSDLLKERAVIERLAHRLEVRSEDLNLFHCVIPGHGERNASAGIAPGLNGVHVYHCRHGRSVLSYDGIAKSVFLLGEIFAFQTVGQEFEMNGPERWIWSIRLLIEAGVVCPASTADVVPLPETAPASARMAWEGFRRLLECRRLYAPASVTPLARRFLARWCKDLTDHHARKGIGWLTAERFLVSFHRESFTPMYQATDGNGKIIGSMDSWRSNANVEDAYVADLLDAPTREDASQAFGQVRAAR